MWWSKALVQWVLSRVPAGDRINHRLQSARGAFSRRQMLHLFVIQAEQIRRIHRGFDLSGKTVMELGPGPFARGCLAFYLYGARRIYTYDHLPQMQLDLILRLIGVVRENSRRCADALGIDVDTLKQRLAALGEPASRDEMLARLNVEYVTHRDATQTGLPSGAIDFVFTYGVLEHIPADQLRPLLIEMRRVLAADGRAYHNIGTHDHFHHMGAGNGVNFLKFSDRTWNALTGHKLAYHNRMRYPEYLSLFADCGYACVWYEPELLDCNLDAIQRIHVHEKFARFSDVENAASQLFIELAPSSTAPASRHEHGRAAAPEPVAAMSS